MGKIIGKRGSNIANVKEKTGVIIKVENETNKIYLRYDILLFAIGCNPIGLLSKPTIFAESGGATGDLGESRDFSLTLQDNLNPPP